MCFSYYKQHVHLYENLWSCSSVKDYSPPCGLSYRAFHILHHISHISSSPQRAAPAKWSMQFGTLITSLCDCCSEACPTWDCAIKVLSVGCDTMCALAPSAPQFSSLQFPFAILEFGHTEIILFPNYPILKFLSLPLDKMVPAATNPWLPLASHPYQFRSYFFNKGFPKVDTPTWAVSPLSHTQQKSTFHFPVGLSILLLCSNHFEVIGKCLCVTEQLTNIEAIKMVNRSTLFIIVNA